MKKEKEETTIGSAVHCHVPGRTTEGIYSVITKVNQDGSLVLAVYDDEINQVHFVHKAWHKDEIEEKGTEKGQPYWDYIPE